jgi:hypothetical protein
MGGAWSGGVDSRHRQIPIGVQSQHFQQLDTVLDVDGESGNHFCGTSVLVSDIRIVESHRYQRARIDTEASLSLG